MASDPSIALPDWYRADIFDAYCLEIGRLTAMWASLEKSMDSLIWELLNVEANKGACLAAQMIGPGPRARALQALIEQTAASDELRGEFRQFGKLAVKLGGQRNRYSHDPVTMGMQTFRLVTHEITADGGKLRAVRNPVDIKAIRLLWVRVREAQELLRKLRFDLIAELPAWKRTRYTRSVANPPHDTPDQG